MISHYRIGAPGTAADKFRADPTRQGDDMKITVTHDDGTEQDITELVQIAYDVVTGSMDWGSGFLDREDTNGLILLAEACRFPNLDEVLQEQWRARTAEGKRHDELQQIARDRGAKWWHGTEPTSEERDAFLRQIRDESGR